MSSKKPRRKPVERRRRDDDQRYANPGTPTEADAADPRDADYISGETLRRRLLEALG